MEEDLSKACSDRERGKGLKLKDIRFRLHIKKKSFTVKVVRQWNRLPIEAMDVPSLVSLDGPLSNMA